MSFHFQPASPSIAPAVRAFWGFDEEISVGAPDERIVPDGCAEIIVQFGDVFHERNTGGYLEQPRVVFAGQITRPLWLRVGMRADVFAVRLQPGGARRLGLPPQWMLADQRLVMADLMAPSMRARFDECLERMAGAPTFDARAAHMHAFIESIISLHPIDAAERCIASISGRRGDCDLARVAAEAGISTRQMQRRFLDVVGVTPKLFARIVRFQGAFERWDEDAADWARVAADCGYYDQPHLLRDFRQFAGDPPAAFLAALAPLGSSLVAAR